MAAVELWVMVGAEVVRVVRGVVPPTAPVKVAVPAVAVTMRLLAPLRVEPNVTELAPELMVLEAVPVRLTGLGNESGLAPLIVMLFRTWIKRALVKTRLLNEVTVLSKEIVPPVPASRVSTLAPVSVLEKVMLAPVGDPVVAAMVLDPLMVKGPLNPIASPVVPIAAARVVAPLPDCVKGPSKVKAPLSAAAPVLARTKGPPTVVLTVPLRVNVVPVREMPETAFVSSAPKVEPVPVTWVMLAAVIAPDIVVAALVMVRAPRRVPDPTAPVKVMFPVPATRLRLFPPSSVVLKARAPLLVVIVLGPVMRTGLANVSVLSPVTVTLLATSIRLPLLKVMLVRGKVPPTAPLNEMMPLFPAAKVKEVIPLIVEEKEIFAPFGTVFVVSNVGAPLIDTGPVSVIVFPAVVRPPPILIAVAPV